MITVYSKSVCPQCTIAKSKLKLAGVDYKEVFVDRDPVARQAMMDAGHRSVPIFYVDGIEVELNSLLNKGK